MSSSLKGAKAIVTGGSRGYGAGIAAVLVERGAQVWITGRDEAALCKAEKATGAKAIKADVTSPPDWDRVFEIVASRDKRLDILINNAGAGINIAPTADQKDAEIAASIAVNLTGAIYGCRRAAKLMIPRKSGTIINVLSVCATQAWPGFGPYSAAKAGLMQFTKCLYTELRPHGVRATSVIPSWGNTDFGRALGYPPPPPKEAAKRIQPRELGELIASICELPAHLAIQDVTLWPLVQKVEPL
jgi:NAD(P)-dependent dehydrogenase (short-subunit alcohol dehydrogenase family)